MPKSAPDKDAEWMMKAIIDDFALSLKPPDRAGFYERLSQLLLDRCDLREEFAGHELGSDLWVE